MPDFNPSNRRRRGHLPRRGKKARQRPRQISQGCMIRTFAMLIVVILWSITSRHRSLMDQAFVNGPEEPFPTTTITITTTTKPATTTRITPNATTTDVHELKPADGSHNTSSSYTKLQLRLNWLNLKPRADLTRRMVSHQSNCSLPMGTFLFRNRFGLGSDLHIWGQALCNGLHAGLRLRTVGNWTWMDQAECRHHHHHHHHSSSPMLCYFQQSELNCPGDVDEAARHPGFDPFRSLSRANGIVKDECPSIYESQGYDKGHVRRSALEFLFTRVTPLLRDEAERQLNRVFGGLQEVPQDLITVHIRWGDKKREMKLVEIHEYIKGIRQILDRRSDGDRSSETANIYLATEDPAAVRQFREQLPDGWNMYVDDAFEELLPYRVTEYNGSPKMSKSVNGRAGLVVLGSLLVAMEANDFVLTTASNWSRLMNELRQAILDPRCDNCTTIVDLRKVRNEW